MVRIRKWNGCIWLTLWRSTHNSQTCSWLTECFTVSRYTRNGNFICSCQKIESFTGPDFQKQNFTIAQ